MVTGTAAFSACMSKGEKYVNSLSFHARPLFTKVSDYLQFSANAICSTDQERVFETCCFQITKTSKTSKIHITACWGGNPLVTAFLQIR